MQTMPEGWYPDPQQPGMERYWFGNEWSAKQMRPAASQPPPPAPGWAPGYPSEGYTPQQGYAPQQKTSGLAIASLVLSILWLGGLGALLAVIFGARARRNIRRSGGAQSGEGLALAGLIIGIVGLVGAVLLYAVLASVGSTVHRAFTPSTLSLGRTAQIPSANQSDGIARVTIYSIQYPVQSQDSSLSPDPGKEFAVADVQACAGPNGSQNGPNPLEFSLTFSGTDSVSAEIFGTPKAPGLRLSAGYAAGQCSRGYLAFQIATGSHPTDLQYLLLNAYRWPVPASG